MRLPSRPQFTNLPCLFQTARTLKKIFLGSSQEWKSRKRHTRTTSQRQGRLSLETASSLKPRKLHKRLCEGCCIHCQVHKMGGSHELRLRTKAPWTCCCPASRRCPRAVGGPEVPVRAVFKSTPLAHELRTFNFSSHVVPPSAE